MSMPPRSDNVSVRSRFERWYGAAVVVVGQSWFLRTSQRCFEIVATAWGTFAGRFPPLFSANGSAESRSEERYAAATALVGDSWVIRTLERCFTLVVTKWRTSAVGTGLAAYAKDPLVSPSQWVRRAGCAAVSAAIVHALLVGVSAFTKPPLTGVTWIVLVPTALVCVCWPGSVVSAWRSSRIIRVRKGDSGST